MLRRSLSTITNRSTDHDVEGSGTAGQHDSRRTEGVASLLEKVDTLLSSLSTAQEASDAEPSSSGGESRNKMRLLFQIEDVSRNYKSAETRIQRVEKWLPTARSDGSLPWAISETAIDHPVEHQAPETPAESLVREKQAVYLSLLNPNQNSDEETESEKSDDELFDKTGPGPFMFSPGRPELRDLLFMQVLTRCQPFNAEEGALRAFLRCAHLLTTSQATRSFFTGFPIRRREKILYGRYRVLRSWISEPDQWIHLEHGTKPQDDEELRRLISEMVSDEIEYSLRGKKRSQDYSPPSSLCRSISSCNRSESGSSGWA